jgi:hypothetical protein
MDPGAAAPDDGAADVGAVRFIDRPLAFGAVAFPMSGCSPPGLAGAVAPGGDGVAAGGGRETTGTQSLGDGVHFRRSGGVNHMARNRLAWSATATPNHMNSRRRLGGALRLNVSEAMIPGEVSRYWDGGGSSGMGSRDLGARRSGNLMTWFTMSF